MKIEKLTEDKIRITLDLTDLKENDIDYQSFMANSIDTQKLFFDMLEEAEEQVGFETENYKIAIEAIATIDGTFILTVTRSLPEEGNKAKPITAKRKLPLIKKDAIYHFACFDDFCAFCKACSSLSGKIAQKISLYCFHEHYYLLFSNVNRKNMKNRTFFSLLTEFSKFVPEPELFQRKLLEYGNLVMKHNAIELCQKYFIHNH